MKAKKILVVEDERLVAEDIAECLRTRNLEVCGICNNGPSAIETARETNPDLVLMDMVLQGDMDGIDTAKVLKSEMKISVVFLTAYSQEGVVERAKAVEPLGYVVKPFEEGTLLSTVEIALHKSVLDHELRESAEWFSTTLNSIGDGVIATDQNGKVKYLNKLAETLTGWDIDDAEGLHIEEVFQIVHESSRSKVANPAIEAMQSGSIQALADNTVLVRKDGGEIPIDDSGAPIHNPEGEIVGSVLVFRDVTEKKAAEQEVARYQQHLEELVQRRTRALAYRIEMERMVIEISSDLIRLSEETYEQGVREALEKIGRIIRLDGCGIYRVEIEKGQPAYVPEAVWAADERMLHAVSEVRKGAEDVFPWWSQELSTKGKIIIGSRQDVPAQAPNERALLETMGVESMVVLPLGDLHNLRWTASFSSRKPRDWNENDLIMFEMLSGVFKNVVERRSMESKQRVLQEQLNQSQKLEAIGKLTGGIAHDFNNMLVPILGYADSILSGESAESARTDIDEIRKAAESAAALTGQLLAFSKKQILHKKPLSINALIQDMKKLLTRVLGEDIHFKLNLADELAHVEADRSQLEQVLLNLCVNARDAMVDGGDLHVRTFSAKDERGLNLTCFEVRDSGCGMGEETLESIFDPFFTTKGSGGTGLGLSVVLGVTDQHNGKVRVSSKQGVGTAFIIALPASKKRSADEKTVKKVSTAEVKGNGERILLIEDEPAVLKFVQRALENQGFVIAAAMRKAAAIEMFDEDPEGFDMVFTDAKLPDGNGIDVLEHVLTQRPGMPALISSGYTDDRALVDQARSRGVEFLQKPYALDKLRETVSNIIKGKSSPDEEVVLPG